jgi:hypothetical protein
MLYIDLAISQMWVYIRRFSRAYFAGRLPWYLADCIHLRMTGLRRVEGILYVERTVIETAR